MMRMPDGRANRLSRFLTPLAVADHRKPPVNALGYLRVMFAWTIWTIRWAGSMASEVRRRNSPVRGRYRSATSAAPKAFSSDLRRRSADALEHHSARTLVNLDHHRLDRRVSGSSRVRPGGATRPHVACHAARGSPR